MSKKRDYKKDAWQNHTAFHQLYLNQLPEDISSGLHSVFDGMIMLVENMADRITFLEGQLEEARRAYGKAKVELPPFQRG